MKPEKQQSAALETDKRQQEIADQQQNELINQLNEAFKSPDSLIQIGKLMYKTFRSKEYSGEVVLKAIKQVYDRRNAELNPPKTLKEFIEAFGPGLVKLCQNKLIRFGGFDLGKSGKKKNGVDGKFGKRTEGAFNKYLASFNNQPSSGTPKQVPQGATKKVPPQITLASFGASLPASTSSAEALAAPSRFDQLPEKYQKIVSPKTKPREYFNPETNQIERQSKPFNEEIQNIYRRFNTEYKLNNLAQIFGNKQQKVERFIVKKDPLNPSQDIKLFDRPITGGINMLMLIFLKIWEEKIQHLHYKPHGIAIGGFEYRPMNVTGGNQGDPGIPLSFHAYGAAIDIDSSANGPKKDPDTARGDIPDPIILAAVESGLTWAGVEDKSSPSFLGNDPMHFQLRFSPESAQAQAIINASPAGKKYWEVVQPMLEQIRMQEQNSKDRQLQAGRSVRRSRSA